MSLSASRVDRILARAAQQRSFTAASLLVAVEGQPVIHRAYGKATIDTVFDLASLTKPLATTAAVMQLVADRRLRLETRVAQILPALADTPAGPLRVWQLLAHCSGLPAWRPFFETVRQRPAATRRSAVRRLAARQPLEHAPGERVVYSDLGFILLDWLVERTSGKRLDRFCAERIYHPLGLSRTTFIDLRRAERRERLLARWPFAPTERCPWRKRRLVGEVHDDNAHVMGGIAGHAGLFSTAHDIHLLVRELMAAYRGRRSILAPAVVRRFFDFRTRAAGPMRALGWDRPGPDSTGAGRRFGPATVGHLGFTGTSLWIDLDEPLWVVLLTNRVYSGREPNPMPRLRPRLHDAVWGTVRRNGVSHPRAR